MPGYTGALSTVTGCVDIPWRTEGENFMMSWTERDGPLGVSTAAARVRKEMAERSTDGRVEFDYAPAV
jgi:hypothetical protein